MTVDTYQSGEGRLTSLSLASDHQVIIRLADDQIQFKFFCKASVAAMCLVRCAEECESWGPDHQEQTGHKLITSERCNFVEWMDATSQDHFYLDGLLSQEPKVLHDGPIEISYDDGYTWKFFNESSQWGLRRIFQHDEANERCVDQDESAEAVPWPRC